MSPKRPRTRFLSALSPKQRLKLCLDSPQRSVHRGSYLYMPGDEAENLYILQSGRIKIRQRPLEWHNLRPIFFESSPSEIRQSYESPLYYLLVK